MTQPANPSPALPTVIELPRGPATIIDEGDGQALLALHGLPGSVRDFRWLAPCLSPHCRFIRVDLPGLGDTPFTTGRGHSLAARAEFVIDIMDALSLERVFLIGHSIGGPLALAAANRRPDEVRGVALLCSVGLRPHPVFRNFNRPLVARALATRVLRRALMPRLSRAFIGAGFPKRVPDAAIMHSIRYASTTKFEEHRRLAAALRASTMVVWAEDDHVIPPEFCLELADVCPAGPRLSFPEGGHNLQKTMAVELGEALTRWMDMLT